MSSSPLPWVLLGAGVLGVGGVLLYSRKASAALPPPGALSPAGQKKVAGFIAATRDPATLQTFAAGLQKNGQTAQALDALQKAADITGQPMQVPGALGLPTVTITPRSPAEQAQAASFAPASGGASSYTVANGDFPGAIAKRFGVSLSTLAKANGPKASRIAAGQIRAKEVLALPPGALDRGPMKNATGATS